MIRAPPRATRTYTLVPYCALFRSRRRGAWPVLSLFPLALAMRDDGGVQCAERPTAWLWRRLTSRISASGLLWSGSSVPPSAPVQGDALVTMDSLVAKVLQGIDR